MLYSPSPNLAKIEYKYKEKGIEITKKYFDINKFVL